MTTGGALGHEEALELRCENRLQGILVPGEYVETKCRNARCGAVEGVIVLHRFDINSGQLIKTLRFTDPVKERVRHGA